MAKKHTHLHISFVVENVYLSNTNINSIESEEEQTSESTIKVEIPDVKETTSMILHELKSVFEKAIEGIKVSND
ncbi:hypothetical protein V9L05_19835 [Bernardetia sp. Wsw4-3y2]|uniref:hypothetical protein n=1 Tax=Bernardetia sp. Wsw4-3y2 TaxID=3127471 RepID=UPI0030D0CBD8